MLTGRRPFRGEHREAVFYAIGQLAPEPMNGLVAGVPAELERIVSKCLDKDPSRRYPNAASLRADLARLRASVPASMLAASESSSEVSDAGIPEAGRSQSAALFSWNRRWLLGVAAATLLILVTSFFWSFVKQSHRDQNTSVASTVPRLAVLPFETRTPG